MFEKAIDDIDLADIKALAESDAPEDVRLEFKRDHYGRNDKARREFAADISAFANRFGG